MYQLSLIKLDVFKISKINRASWNFVMKLWQLDAERFHDRFGDRLSQKIWHERWIVGLSNRGARANL